MTLEADLDIYHQTKVGYVPATTLPDFNFPDTPLKIVLFPLVGKPNLPLIGTVNETP